VRLSFFQKFDRRYLKGIQAERTKWALETVLQQVFSREVSKRRHTPTFEENFEMSHIVKFGAGEVEERLGALEKYLESLQLHRDSRKGLEGARGPAGENSVVQGPQGPAGRDADITQVVEAALKKVKEEFDQEYAILAQVVRHALVTGGVLDENGKAILIPGPIGPASTIPGPRGEQGERGERGDRGSTGEPGVSNIPGPVGPQGERGERGEQGPAGADSVVPGPVGERGPDGQQGIPGVSLSREDIGKLVLSMKQRGSI